jgi:hypothetical protein
MRERSFDHQIHRRIVIESERHEIGPPFELQFLFNNFQTCLAATSKSPTWETPERDRSYDRTDRSVSDVVRSIWDGEQTLAALLES